MKRIFQFFVFSLLILCGACKKTTIIKEEPKPEPEEIFEFANGVVPSPVFDVEGGSEQIVFVSPNSWIASKENESLDWFDFSPRQAGKGLAQIKLTVDASSGNESREGDFIIQSGDYQFSIHIVQTQIDTLIVAKSKFAISAKGGELQVPIAHNIPVTVSVKDDWIRQIASRGFVKEVLCFEVDPLQGDAPRKTEIIVEAIEKNLRQHIEVLQDVHVKISDANFKQYLLSHFDLNSDGEMSMQEMAQITEIDCSRTREEQSSKEAIHTLDGIELMPNLKKLNCAGNEISMLNLKEQTLLEELVCNENSLDTLILTSLPNLKTLDCSKNHLRGIDVSKNEQLESLVCWTNQIDTLNISQNKGLKVLNCQNNKIRVLDLENNLQLNYFACSHNALKNLDISRNTAIKSLFIYGCPDLKVVYVWPGFSLILFSDVEVDANLDFVEIGS